VTRLRLQFQHSTLLLSRCLWLHADEYVCTDLEIRSVDGYQGREKDVILLSTVRANSNQEVRATALHKAYMDFGTPTAADILAAHMCSMVWPTRLATCIITCTAKPLTTALLHLRMVLEYPPGPLGPHFPCPARRACMPLGCEYTMCMWLLASVL
jgi:hypothetical protein